MQGRTVDRSLGQPPHSDRPVEGNPDGLAANALDLLTTEEVASSLRVKPSAVTKMVRRGVLPAVKIGRRWYFLRDDLRSELRRRTRTSRASLAAPDIDRLLHRVRRRRR